MSDVEAPEGRVRITDEQTVARFPKGTFDAMSELLEEKETRSEFIRRAVKREITRRQRRC